jgi:hypothetical protein
MSCPHRKGFMDSWLLVLSFSAAAVAIFVYGFVFAA